MSDKQPIVKVGGIEPITEVDLVTNEETEKRYRIIRTNANIADKDAFGAAVDEAAQQTKKDTGITDGSILAPLSSVRPFRIGDKVQRRDKPGMVGAVRAVPSAETVFVQWGVSEGKIEAVTDLELVERF